MNIKIRFFLTISTVSFMSLEAMTPIEAYNKLMKAAHDDDVIASVEAMENGANLAHLAGMGNFLFIEKVLDCKDILDKIKHEQILEILQKILKNEIEKDTSLPHDLTEIILEYENPFPTNLSELKKLSVEEIKKLVHIYDEHSKVKKHHCLIM